MAVNFWDEPKETLQAFVKEKKLTHRILLNGSGVAETYGVYAAPTSLWIDRAGVVVDVAIGFDDPKEFEAKTKALVARNR